MDPEALLHSRPLALSESVVSPLPHLSNRDSEEQEQNEGAMTDSGTCYNYHGMSLVLREIVHH